MGSEKMPIRDPALREQYRAEQTGCELAPLIGCCNGHGTWRGLQIHHILGGPHRHDIRINLILICDESHDWLTDSKPIEGKAACWLVKKRKGEFDPEAIGATGAQNPLGWIESKRSESKDPRVVSWVKELTETGMT